MTTLMLEKKLMPFSAPVEGGLLRWLYLHLPPRPIENRKMHKGYGEAFSILMGELEMKELSASDLSAIRQYLSAIIPFVEEYEQKEFPIGDVSAEDMLRSLMESHKLTQYDLAKELGGQPVVSNILNGKRKLSRKQIERLAVRFHISPATFYARPTVPA